MPYPDSESEGWRFRAPDLVWHNWRTRNSAAVDGFIVLLNSQLRTPRAGKPSFGPRWLQRFDRQGNVVGSPLDLDVVARALLQDDTLDGANWEGLGWYDEARVVLVHDKSRGIETPAALIIDLRRFWAD